MEKYSIIKAGSYEVKRAYQYMDCRFDDGKIIVKNLYDFTNLSEFTFKYVTENDGAVIEEKELVLDTAPKQSAEIEIDVPESTLLGAYVTCYLYDKTGYETAMCQIELPAEKRSEEINAEKAEISENEHSIMLKSNDNVYTISKHSGMPVSITVNGREQLKRPCRLSVWRAPTDNDRNIRQKWGWYNIWEGENFNRLFQKAYDVCTEDGKVRVRGSLAGVSRTPFMRFEITYSVCGKGLRVDISADIKDRCIWLPRFGMDFFLDYNADNFEYFGMGPKENYRDMCRSAKMGRYKSSADGEYVNYIMPQEHGNHTKAKYLKVENSLMFEGDFEFNVSHYSAEMLTEAMHIDELEKSDCTNVRIDYKVSGIGSNSCGPELLEKYRLSEKEFKYTFFVNG